MGRILAEIQSGRSPASGLRGRPGPAQLHPTARGRSNHPIELHREALRRMYVLGLDQGHVEPMARVLIAEPLAEAGGCRAPLTRWTRGLP